MKKVIFIIAFNGFRDEEYQQPREELEKNGILVTVASSGTGTATGKLGLKVNIDKIVKDVAVGDYEALVLVGGPGCYDYYDDRQVQQLVRDFHSAGKVTAGICSAAAILAIAGILKGIRATVFPGEAERLKKAGAIYGAKGLEVDGKIITADGPENARRFGSAIATALS
ncbi:MAG: DJ-1/PfpI family protein [Candidatus Margulisbacteria bacterium]|nr:DJ-1/PfpI family protein [Candidatus Margulisiibacteriota bacterium]MBU1616816.1 DJ-1/PfpI family protein [Candidatus Margulisiibacteriota bacterium]MBU1867807.1 DJ-1/PfpI family protein [Candidatus Margulisiibacteriota bacterium]